MHYVILGFLTAIGKLIVLVKLLGWGRLVRIQLPLDVIFTFLFPLALGFSGTITGAMVGVMAGIWFSVILGIASIFVKPRPLLNRCSRESR